MLRTIILSSLILITLTIPCLSETFKATDNVEAYISPNGVDTEAIVKEINSAKSEILLQADWITFKPIADALVNAQKRGVKIEAVIDNSKHDKDILSSNLGFYTYIDSMHIITNNKAMIIDRRTIIFSSSNQTSGKDNSGNLIILKGNMPMVEKYIRNYEEHKGHSEGYHGK
jgi:phosphatidylserine/phosphatidylglycerophosphate/cardiolipin synthase-like enzyme